MRGGAAVAVLASALLALSLGAVAGEGGDAAAPPDDVDTTKQYQSSLPGAVIELSDTTLKQAVQVSLGHLPRAGRQCAVRAKEPHTDSQLSIPVGRRTSLCSPSSMRRGAATARPSSRSTKRRPKTSKISMPTSGARPQAFLGLCLRLCVLARVLLGVNLLPPARPLFLFMLLFLPTSTLSPPALRDPAGWSRWT
jgi:hypothetical protein